jgi:hypothetical protein
VVTLGDAPPGLAADASIGLVVLTPAKAMVTMETCVGGLTRAEGFVCPAVTTVEQATRRAPPLLALSSTRVHPALQLIEVNE